MCILFSGRESEIKGINRKRHQKDQEAGSAPENRQLQGMQANVLLCVGQYTKK
jgi:hypothetical protein